jgi:hypothetical protein
LVLAVGRLQREAASTKAQHAAEQQAQGLR